MRKVLALLAFAPILALVFNSCETLFYSSSAQQSTTLTSSSTSSVSVTTAPKARTVEIITPPIEGTNVPGKSLAEKLVWLQRNVESHNNYIVEVNGNENIAPTNLLYNGAINITIVLKGDSINRIIRLSSHGKMFSVFSNVTFILDNNITLQGHSDNTGAIVDVSGGKFIMNTGATITGNIQSNNKGFFISSRGGGVCVSSGTFTMNGGVISNNTAVEGGGVYVASNFVMNGGVISGNTASAGGGVHISRNNTFTMIGGTITDNTASKGGGVFTTGIFTMRGGTITRNTATEYGGGVCIDWGTHLGHESTKTGGIITGYNSDPSEGNVVRDHEGVLARRGHAFYVNAEKRREKTAGIGINLSANRSDNWEQ